MASTSGPRRLHRFLMKELAMMRTDPTPGITLDPNQETDITKWTVEMRGAEGTIYAGELFKLQFEFTDDYPYRPPKVRFLPPFVPLNPHVFSNGDICLSILTKDWAPCLHVQGVCLSVLSMLSSCKTKVLPPDNDYYLRMKATAPEKYTWVYYDDKA